VPCRRTSFFAPGGRCRTSPGFFPVSGIADALACSTWPRGATAVSTFAPQLRRSPTLLEQAGGILAYPSGRALSPRTARPPRGREEARSAGRWRSVEGWRRATPPCEERGAAARRDEHYQQTMTGEFRAGHGRQRSHIGREDQADATTGGSVVCRLRVPAIRHDRRSRIKWSLVTDYRHGLPSSSEGGGATGGSGWGWEYKENRGAFLRLKVIVL